MSEKPALLTAQSNPYQRLINITEQSISIYTFIKLDRHSCDQDLAFLVFRGEENGATQAPR